MKKIFLVAVFIILFSTAARADMLLLKSGKKVDGTIVEETDEYYKIDADGMVLTYYEDEILRIEKGAAPEEEFDVMGETESVELAKEEAATKSSFGGKGSGFVVGKVIMPTVSGSNGKLYFKLTSFDLMDLKDINTSIVIDGKSVSGQEITYSFDELPLGKYFVIAVWDLAEPYCTDGDDCPAFKGDYTGGSQVVEIKASGETATADIMLMGLIG
ncbi:MAG: hypothetical protein KAS92_07570 [Candidatus Omnitrophica bacterium]|nr:hypothetical protein [Candidatus Omnitrophota bacterium]